MDNNRVNEIVMRETWEQYNSLRGTIRVSDGEGSFNTGSMFAVAFLALQIKQYDIEDEKELLDHISCLYQDDEIVFLNDSMSSGTERIFELAKRCEERELREYLLTYSDKAIRFGGENETPHSIIKLIIQLMHIQKEDKVADLGCGIGCFITEAASQTPEAEFFGIEINTTSKQIASLKGNLVSDNVEIDQGDMFDLCNCKKFDKVFSNYPFGIQLRNMRGGRDYLEELKMTFPDIVKATSSDWIYNSLLLSTLKETGKAYAIMTNGSTWNGTDKSIREYFVRKGFIETIISLPANMFSGMSMATTLIVLSYGNSSVRMIDASKIFIVGRRQNIFSDENIALIVNLLSTDTENSALVSFDDIAKNDYVINPSRYLAEEIEIKDGVEFGSVIKRITRGAPLRAEELDKMVSLEPTMYQYLMLANIKDGIIDENLPYIKDIDQKLEKYCIKNNSLVLSKNGAPFKVAVAEVEEGKKILGNGNLYIIELDEEKINPFYLKAFFDSEIGETVLKRIAVGATMPNITVEALKKINVPMPTMEKQIQVVERTRAKMDEVKVLRLRLERAIQSMKTFFEED